MSNVKIKNFNWAFTNKCNLQCLHCIVSSGQEKCYELSTQQAKNIIDQLYKINCNCIHFTGGECLSKSNFLEVAQYCKYKNIDTTLVTNGTLVDESNINDIKNIFHDIRISLNGIDANSNDKIRGKGNFAKTIKAMELIKSKNIPLILFITLGNNNFYDINNIIKLCWKYNVSGFKIDYTVIGGRAAKNKDIFYLNDFQIRWLVNEFSKNFQSKIQEDDKCNANSKSLYLTAEGNVYPCVHLALNNVTKYLLGNIRETSIENMIRKCQSKIDPICQNKKCIHKFYFHGRNYILGVRNLNNSICLT